MEFEAEIETDEKTGLIRREPPHPHPLARTSRSTEAPKVAVHRQHNLLWPGPLAPNTHPPKPTDRNPS
ncbi:MAG: hypothetical protein OXB92_02345 [Acidimicrobiaceae bacterium]|nr:hypothetical protein [Acidimicrobiia bacterium]MCY4492683.1 hypothetical protein [Acidimicrobiaceae bacterium]